MNDTDNAETIKKLLTSWREEQAKVAELEKKLFDADEQRMAAESKVVELTKINQRLYGLAEEASKEKKTLWGLLHSAADRYHNLKEKAEPVPEDAVKKAVEIAIDRIANHVVHSDPHMSDWVVSLIRECTLWMKENVHVPSLDNNIIQSIISRDQGGKFLGVHVVSDFRVEVSRETLTITNNGDDDA